MRDRVCDASRIVLRFTPSSGSIRVGNVKIGSDVYASALESSFSDMFKGVESSESLPDGEGCLTPRALELDRRGVELVVALGYASK